MDEHQFQSLSLLKNNAGHGHKHGEEGSSMFSSQTKEINAKIIFTNDAITPTQSLGSSGIRKGTSKPIRNGVGETALMPNRRYLTHHRLDQSLYRSFLLMQNLYHLTTAPLVTGVRGGRIFKVRRRRIRVFFGNFRVKIHSAKQTPPDLVCKLVLDTIRPWFLKLQIHSCKVSTKIT